jgi:hypothetical protein
VGLAVVARALLLQTVVARIVVLQNVVRSAVVAQAAVLKNVAVPVSIGSGDTQWKPVLDPVLGSDIWTRTPIWPQELIFPGIISVRHSS